MNKQEIYLTLIEPEEHHSEESYVEFRAFVEEFTSFISSDAEVSPTMGGGPPVGPIENGMVITFLQSSAITAGISAGVSGLLSLIGTLLSKQRGRELE